MTEFLSRISDVIGIIGVIMLLGAYFLLSINKISSQSLIYHIFNFLGSGLILFSLIFAFNLPAFIIEIAWMMISIIGMYRVFSARKKPANRF